MPGWAGKRSVATQQLCVLAARVLEEEGCTQGSTCALSSAQPANASSAALCVHEHPASAGQVLHLLGFPGSKMCVCRRKEVFLECGGVHVMTDSSAG